MSTTALRTNSEVAAQTRTMSIGRLLRTYLTEAEYECVRMLRAPSFGLVFLSLPVLLYLLFGLVIFGDSLRRDPIAARFVFTAFVVFGAMGPAMFGFGVTVAIEREQGLLKLKRALPMPPAAYLIAKMLMAMLFAAMIMVTVTIAGLSLCHLKLSAGQILGVALTNILGVVPFCAIGLFIGAWAKGAAAPGFTHLFYMPMVYLSGLFFPLPKSLQAMAPIWPAFHLQQLTFRSLGIPSQGGAAMHVAVLFAAALFFGLLAWRRLSRIA
jgi:ABC-2 type transport system permease protein